MHNILPPLLDPQPLPRAVYRSSVGRLGAIPRSNPWPDGCDLCRRIRDICHVYSEDLLWEPEAERLLALDSMRSSNLPLACVSGDYNMGFVRDGSDI